MCELTSLLRTRPPVGEEGEEFRCADGAVAVEVGGVPRVRPPGGQQRHKIGHADGAIAVKVLWTPLRCSFLELVGTHVHDRAVVYNQTDRIMN